MSDLLNKASLVMIPSGYKATKVYSEIPTDGSGDLSFTRSSDGTRVNSAGLVEVCPWNLLEYSEDFSNGYWGKDVGATVNSNVATAPNGTTTADRLNYAGAGQAVYKVQTFEGANTFSVYLKGEGANIGKQIYLEIGNATGSKNVTLTGEWQRFETDANDTGSIAIKRLNSGQADSVLAWGIQVNQGALKPYFPTTDRLNVPRLTYQNGGGGCPSLLLEKQSTNTIVYSEQFDNAAWTIVTGGGTASGSVTANYGISPDGTQNADRIQLNKGNTGYAEIYQGIASTSGVIYSQTMWLKSLSGTPKINFGFTGSTRGTITLTTEWQRYTFTYTSGGTFNAVALTLYDGFDPSTAQSIDILAWGAQIEVSSYPTSYIPTTSSSATRVADACYKTGISSLIGQTEGTLFVDLVMVNDISSVNRVISITETNWLSGGSIRIDIQSFNITVDFVNNNTFIGTISVNTAFAQNTRYKIAIAYKTNDCALYMNGTQLGTNTSIGTMPTCSEFYLNELGGGFGGPWEPTEFNQAALFKTRLSNAELASLTTI